MWDGCRVRPKARRWLITVAHWAFVVVVAALAGLAVQIVFEEPFLATFVIILVSAISADVGGRLSRRVRRPQ
jgi:hypothetical protein